jgi:hypothetical protein
MVGNQLSRLVQRNGAGTKKVGCHQSVRLCRNIGPERGFIVSTVADFGFALIYIKEEGIVVYGHARLIL